MTCVVVLGTHWGDEGKGKIVDLLTARALAVVRFQGGSNAGHTLKIDGRQTVLHLVPCGAMHAGVHCYIGNGVALNLALLAEELTGLSDQGVDLSDRLHLSWGAPLVLPHHIALDQAREAKLGKQAIGTTGRGIGPCYEDRAARRGLRLADLQNMTLAAERLESALELHNFMLEHYYQAAPVDYAEALDSLQSLAQQFTPLGCDITEPLDQHIRAGEAVLFEGAQGIMLDLEHGTYPYVTSSNTVAAAAAVGSGLGPQAIRRVLGVSKAYTTRVGAGPLPTELAAGEAEQMREIGDEYGATTGRPRRCGWLDVVVLRRAVLTGGVDALAITKLDVLDTFTDIKLCTHYRYQGEMLTLPPSQAAELDACEPVYETCPGWQQSTGGIRNYADLPENAKRYLARIEELTGCPLALVSTGPEREATIVLRDVFGLTK